MVARHVMSAIVAIPVLEFIRLLVLTIPYTKQGFFCEDVEIRYPHHTHETIYSNQMFSLFFSIAVLLVISIEYTLIRHLTRDQRRRLAKGSSKIHPGLLNIIYFMISLICSMLTTSVIVNLGKRTVSRLRPNFLDVCKPNLTALCPPDTFRFVDDYFCYGESKEDEYFSFPSGHAAQAVNFAVFTIYYLQKRCKLQEPIRPFLQLLIFLLSFFISLSRVRDHMHRLVDVGGGAMIGLFTGIFFVTYVLRHFQPTRYAIEEVGDMNDDPNVVGSAKAFPSPFYPTTAIYENEIRVKPYTHGGIGHVSGYGSLLNSSTEQLYEGLRADETLP